MARETLLSGKAYDNCEMQSINGDFLAFTSFKRMNWYVSRGLAEVIDDNKYQLNFVTNGDFGDKSDYYRLKLENKCVICGDEDNLTKHHIVPYQFRKFIPMKYKKGLSRDVVCICHGCHKDYETIADIFKEELLIKYDLVDDLNISNTLGKYFNTLKNYSHYQTKETIERLSSFITTHVGRPIDEVLKDDWLETVDTSKKLVDLVNVDDFIILWRNHFIETTEPKYLPEEWVKDINRVI